MFSHILPENAVYATRRVPCRETGRYHRHNWHMEKYCEALCGKKVVKGQHKYINITEVSPDFLSRDSCRRCVEAVPWTPEAIERLKAKGFFRGSE